MVPRTTTLAHGRTAITSEFDNCFWNWRVAQCLVLYKVLLFTVVLGTVLLIPDMNLRQFYNAIHWPRTGEPSLASHFATWDGAHYLYLSEVGYSKGSPSCAFYPLLPMLIRITSVITGGNHFFAGLVLTNVLSIFG